MRSARTPTARPPLTERVLPRRPRARALGIAIWGLLPPLNVLVRVGLAEARVPGADIGDVGAFLSTQLLFTYAVVLALWGSVALARGLGEIEQRVAELIPKEDATAESPFRDVGAALPPLVLTLMATLLFQGQAVAQHGWTVGLATAPLGFLIGIPLWTLLWVYVALQLGLDRLGRQPLALDAHLGDRSLGLGPIGSLAYAGFWIFFAMVAPFAVVTIRDPLALVVSLLVLLGGISLFFLSMARLHQQMVAAKERYLSEVRELFAQAYDPVRGEAPIEALESRAGLLAAAHALEVRGEAIQEWPFDERTRLQITFIATGVAASIIGRLILTPAGL